VTPAQYERAASIFHEAASVDKSTRADILAARCGDDAELRLLVEQMLAADDTAGSFLDPKDAGLGELAREAARERPDSTPTRIGAYRVLRRIGAGGMGVVYEAEQDNPRRRVAVKVIRRGLLSPAISRRFQREIEIVGRLHHAGIAQIFEAGVHREGVDELPFFSMEYVEGVALDEFCRGSTAGTHDGSPERPLEKSLAGARGRDAVRLFAQACDAVAYAHSMGVIHRDLKPSNILVKATEAGPAPKILDFGIARLSENTSGATLATETGQLLGTLAYMSPEQISGGDITPASDAYALGVVLFEVLSGRTPYRSVPATIAEAYRLVREEEPTRLGTVARGLGADLETIVGKAMEKDPARRYKDAGELAADLRRYLRDEPILARRPSAIYNFRKFTRRNPGLVGAVVGAFVVMVGAVVAVSSLALKEAEARRESDINAQKASEQAALAEARGLEALRQARAADAVNDVMSESIMLSIAPERHGRDARVLDVLNSVTAERLDRLKDTPLAEAAVRFGVGAAYYRLGRSGEAETHLRRSIELYEQTAGPENARTLQALNELGGLLYSQGRAEEAAPIFRRVADTRRKTQGDDDQLTLGASINLANCLSFLNKPEEALALYDDALGRFARSGREGDQYAIIARHMKARLLVSSGKEAEALALLEEAKRVAEAAGVPLDLRMRNNLALMLLNAGRLDESVKIYEAALPEARRMAGPQAAVTQSIEFNLSMLYIELGRPQEALDLIRPLFDLRLASFGAGDGRTAEPARVLAIALINVGRPADAVTPARVTYEVWKTSDGPASKRAFDGLNVLSLAMRGSGDAAGADKLLDEHAALVSNDAGATEAVNRLRQAAK
jgi:serine/threonine protein kinase/TolA-binding protein